jgi:acylphosphatase
MERAHLFISGKVQGVFFRDSTCQEAAKLGVTGWVRNLRDGRVEAVLEGDPKAVQELVTWCHEGPPRARVEDLEVKEEEPTGSFDGFEKRSTV